MDFEEARHYLGCSKYQLRKACERRLIKHIRLGALYRFRKSALDEFLDSSELASVAPASAGVEDYAGE
jgi:excisionase family DNA binding protein